MALRVTMKFTGLVALMLVSYFAGRMTVLGVSGGLSFSEGAYVSTDAEPLDRFSRILLGKSFDAHSRGDLRRDSGAAAFREACLRQAGGFSGPEACRRAYPD